MLENIIGFHGQIVIDRNHLPDREKIESGFEFCRGVLDSQHMVYTVAGAEYGRITNVMEVILTACSWAHAERAEFICNNGKVAWKVQVKKGKRGRFRYSIEFGDVVFEEGGDEK